MCVCVWTALSSTLRPVLIHMLKRKETEQDKSYILPLDFGFCNVSVDPSVVPQMGHEGGTILMPRKTL